MEARKCERCGRYYDKPERYQCIRVYSDEMKDVSGKLIDLCHDCMHKLVRWLENGLEG